jgi:hypothetical protein
MNTTINHYVNIVIAVALLVTHVICVIKPGALSIALLLIVAIMWASLQILYNAVESVKTLFKKEN